MASEKGKFVSHKAGKTGRLYGEATPHDLHKIFKGSSEPRPMQNNANESIAE